MSYNTKELPPYLYAAGKISVITAVLGVVVFAVIFLLNIGVKELNQAVAQSTGLATTSVTVLNTPPQWTVDAQEVTESSTSSPTNSGDTVSWHATATDSNSEDYYLLICTGTSTPSEPTANVGAAPDCANNQVKWAVSPAASSGEEAVAATTTTEAFAESNVWYAWICDAVTINPRCNSTYKQGTAPTASPFNVNHRPILTSVASSGSALPGNTINYTSVATDTDVVDTNDQVQLWICSSTNFTATATDKCDDTTLASSTLVALGDPTASYDVSVPFPDAIYAAYAFLVDEHNHEASGGAHGTNIGAEVLNATPTVPAGQIVLNDGNDIILTGNATQTNGFTLQFTAQDNNSCETSVAGDEVTDWRISVYRSGVGSTTCDGVTSGSYDANNCYTTGVASTTWNLSCTASSTSCTYGVDGLDDEMVVDCTFPLWFIADPTDGTNASTSFYFAEDWKAAVTAIDDDGATSTNHQEDANPLDTVNLIGFLYFSLDTLSIPYGSLEPGQFSSPLTASTTIRSEGNIGLDEKLSGESMCSTYATNNKCPTSATSTIPDNQQVFATSSVSYATASNTLGYVLSSTSPYRLDINVKKPTTTSTTTNPGGVTYWGIRVPGSITLAGSYTGENTFYGVASRGDQWY